MEPNENIARTTFTYDDLGRLSTICHQGADVALLECITCPCDDAGLTPAPTTGETHVTTYRYDETGQLMAG